MELRAALVREPASEATPLHRCSAEKDCRAEPSAFSVGISGFELPPRSWSSCTVILVKSSSTTCSAGMRAFKAATKRSWIGGSTAHGGTSRSVRRPRLLIALACTEARASLYCRCKGRATLRGLWAPLAGGGLAREGCGLGCAAGDPPRAPLIPCATLKLRT